MKNLLSRFLRWLVGEPSKANTGRYRVARKRPYVKARRDAVMGVFADGRPHRLSEVMRDAGYAVAHGGARTRFARRLERVGPGVYRAKGARRG